MLFYIPPSFRHTWTISSVLISRDLGGLLELRLSFSSQSVIGHILHSTSLKKQEARTESSKVGHIRLLNSKCTVRTLLLPADDDRISVSRTYQMLLCRELVFFFIREEHIFRSSRRLLLLFVVPLLSCSLSRPHESNGVRWRRFGRH